MERTERQLMQNLIRDIRFAFRSLVRKPGLAITAVTALGLGIGLTTAMFSIVNGVVLRGLPVEVMAFGLARMLSLVLFEVGAADPTVFVGIVAVLAVTGMVASFLPALRATRVDPTVAMRAE